MSRRSVAETGQLIKGDFEVTDAQIKILKMHRPTPWEFISADDGDEIIRAVDGTNVHYDTQYYPSGLATVDARFIVDAVNALHRIAGHGNITGDKAREIASEALGIKKPE